MVFLIQNTQNRDALALHLKLDELLRAVTTARTGLPGSNTSPTPRSRRCVTSSNGCTRAR